VDKTGGEQEHQAFSFLQEHLARVTRSRNVVRPRETACHDSSAGAEPIALRLAEHAGGASAGPTGTARRTLPARRFGGVGLMVRQPGIRLTVRPALAWSAEGPLAERALAYARRFVEALPDRAVAPRRLVVEQAAAGTRRPGHRHAAGAGRWPGR